MKSDTRADRKDISRRNFVGGAVALASGAAAMTAGTKARAADVKGRESRTPGCDYDVIVVGGGFAGVTAARDCQKNGYQTLLLEARNRLGGRTFTTEFEGTRIELGGTWIHNTQPFVWAEAQRYGLEVKETPGAVPDVMHFIARDGRHIKLTLEQSVEVAQGWDAYCAAGREILPRPYDILHNREAALKADSVGALDHLRGIQCTPLQYAFNETLLATVANGQTNEISYLDVLRFHLLGGGCFGTFMDALVRFQLKHGTSELIDCIVKDGGAQIRLATPVKAVRDLGEKVVLTVGKGDELSCGALVCTVPMNAIGSIDFQPALPPGVVDAFKQRHPGSGLKMYIKVAGDLGNIALVSQHLPLNYAFTYQQNGDSTLLVAFSSVAGPLDPQDDESVQAALREYLPDAKVLAVAHYDWNMDPFSRGTWATYRPGWVGKYHDQFQRDAGRILFASGDHGEGWRGSIDGAIGAGVRAARRASQMLA